MDIDANREWTEEELNDPTIMRKDLIAIAKAKAEQQGKVLPFGNRKNSDYIDMILGRQPFMEKADKLRETPERVPLGTPHMKLVIPERAKEPGYVYRIINDRGSRLDQALRGGYEFVIDPENGMDVNLEDRRSVMGSSIKFDVGDDGTGKRMTGYAMKIRKDFYEADQAEKQKKVDAVDEAIRGGNTGNDGQYIPKGGISIDSNF